MTDYGVNTPLTKRGKNFDDCRDQIFKERGTNYTIVSHGQKIDSRFFGLMQKEYYEVKYLPKSREAELTQTKNSEIDFEKAKAEILKSVSDATYSKQVASLNSKIDDITKQLHSITESQSPKHETIKKIEDLLEDNEFSFQYINEITERIRNEFSLEQLEDFKLVQRKIVDWIGESIKISPEKFFRPPHVVVLVGPTGVGKTTTIAKFAAKQIREAKEADKALPKFCIMTIDTMRVGAVEQLSRFGAIMNSDVKKAENSDDVQKIYEENKDEVDTFYIDTAGYSPNDSANIGKMKAILDVPGLNPDVYLVMSASTKTSDMKKIMQNYEPFGYRSVIITKCDETEKYGNVISTLNEKHKSMSYICDGQLVARNLERADVIYFLIRLHGFEIDRTHVEDKFGEH